MSGITRIIEDSFNVFAQRGRIRGIDKGMTVARHAVLREWLSEFSQDHLELLADNPPNWEGHNTRVASTPEDDGTRLYKAFCTTCAWESVKYATRQKAWDSANAHNATRPYPAYPAHLSPPDPPDPPDPPSPPSPSDPPQVIPSGSTPIPMWESIARTMLGYPSEPLPATLADELLYVDNLCRMANGTLRSRQVIATCISHWYDRRQDQKKA